MKDNKVLPAGEPASAQARGQTCTPHRILVVDDDLCIRQLSADVLIRSGYEVDIAEDGEAGWQALQAKNYDLLITDNNMPKVSGVELIKKLRAEDITLPIIMASGAIPMEELNRHQWLQLAATLLKPFTIEELLGTVKKVLRTAESARRQAENYFPVITSAVSQTEPLTRGAFMNE